MHILFRFAYAKNKICSYCLKYVTDRHMEDDGNMDEGANKNWSVQIIKWIIKN